MHRIPVLVLALAAIAATPAPTDTKARVDAIFQEYDRSDSPGCALGVYWDGQIVYARGYGMANLDLGVANSPRTVFDLASTSKQFTAFAIHLLARDGKLSLDDDIRKWVPEIPDPGRTITIRHLLHHTSGLRDYLELMTLQGVRDEDLSTEEDSLAILSRQKALNFSPGDEHLYCNSGYFLLSVIVKRLTGKSLRDFTAVHIFGPLGMRDSQFNDSHTRIIPNRATGYSKGECGFGVDMSDYEQTGDGSLLTTVEDLFAWDQNFYEPKVGDRALLEAIQTPGVLNSGEKLDYASGLRISTYKGLPTVSHGGAWVGYRAQLLRFPQQRFTVACLCNLGDANPSALARKVAEVYLGGLMKKEPESADEKRAGNVRLAAPLEKLERLTGSYRSTATGTVVSLAVEEGRLVTEIGGVSYSLTPIADKHFRVEGISGQREVEFETDGKGSPRMRMTTRAFDGDLRRDVLDRVEPWSPTAGELVEFAGTYTSEDVDTTWRLVVEGGKLAIRHRGISNKPLTPSVAGTFTLEEMTITFTRDAAKKVTGFVLDAGRVKGLSFRKQAASL